MRSHRSFLLADNVSKCLSFGKLSKDWTLLSSMTNVLRLGKIDNSGIYYNLLKVRSKWRID